MLLNNDVVSIIMQYYTPVPIDECIDCIINKCFSRWNVYWFPYKGFFYHYRLFTKKIDIELLTSINYLLLHLDNKITSFNIFHTYNIKINDCTQFYNEKNIYNNIDINITYFEYEDNNFIPKHISKINEININDNKNAVEIFMKLYVEKI